ncbi:alpha/beta hydrolase [Hoyosella sp. G463]|uniref:Alpha/beta hydrolase n=1 Tax=Lolliginicoccus lacisalsi TaxID=2742202 RepID=A0A927JC20_9ACTN|nr:alpha/beta family hydrolase [Lolliginicoccus lacisalsi]MBD8506338.1 alpha/beta hydrolase [Lolliginicoccus lacisalsi]
MEPVPTPPVVPVELSDGAVSVTGFLHECAGPRAALALSHGAGSDATSPLLVELASQLASQGVLVLRFTLPFRVRRPSGPPHRAHSGLDRAGIALAASMLRERTSAPVFLGGHSYGGRQSSMLCAEQPDLADGLLLLSYPFHPPGKPDRMRTEHFPAITRPTVFVHGDRDPFSTVDEATTALREVTAPVRLVVIEGGRHDLGGARRPAMTATIVAAARELLVADA